MALATAVLVFAIAQTVVIPVLPLLQHRFGTGGSATAWLVTSFFLSSAVSTPLTGRLGDIHGRQSWLLITLGLFGTGSLICAVGDTFEIVVLGRVVQGFGSGMLPMCVGIVRDEFPSEGTASAIGVIFGTLGAGGALGLVAAGALTGDFPLTSIFWMSFALTAIATVLVALWVPASPERVPRRIDAVGALLLSLSLFAALLAVSESNSWGWLSPPTLGLIAGALLLATATVAWERRAADPILDIELFRDRGVWSIHAATFCLGFGMLTAFTLIPEYAQTALAAGYGYGASVIVGALFLVPATLVQLFAGPLGGRLGARVGSPIPMAIGTFASAVSFVIVAMWIQSKLAVLAAMTLYGLGVGFAFSAASNLAAQSVDEDDTSTVIGINTIVRMSGGAVGAQVSAAIVAASVSAVGFASKASYRVSFAVAASLSLAAFGLTGLMREGRAQP